MKKVLVGIMLAVLMATMIVPALCETEEILDEVYLYEKGELDETGIDKVVTVVEDGTEIKRTYMKNGVIIDEYEEDDCTYIIKYGNTPFVHIEVIQHSKILRTLGRGVSWVKDKCADGYNWVKGLFVRNDD